MNSTFLQKMRIGDVQRWEHPSGAVFIIVTTSESMGYKTDYKQVPTLYVLGTRPDGREDHDHRRFTGKNIKRFFDAIIDRGFVRV